MNDEIDFEDDLPPGSIVVRARKMTEAEIKKHNAEIQANIEAAEALLDEPDSGSC